MRLRLLSSLLALALAGPATAGMSVRRVVVPVSKTMNAGLPAGWTAGQTNAPFRSTLDPGQKLPTLFYAPGLKTGGAKIAAGETSVLPDSVRVQEQGVATVELQSAEPIVLALARTQEVLKDVDPSSPLQTKVVLDALIEGHGRRASEPSWAKTLFSKPSLFAKKGLVKSESGPTRSKKDKQPPTPPPSSPGKKWALAGIVAALIATPVALHADASGVIDYIASGLDRPWYWIAVPVVTLVDLALSAVSYMLVPDEMGPAPKDSAEDMPLLQAAGALLFGALLEEFLFRGLFFGLLWYGLSSAAVPALLAFGIASFLSSFVFSLFHDYGAVWPRVVGGMLYCGAFALTGSLLFPILVHFLFNMTLFVGRGVMSQKRILPVNARFLALAGYAALLLAGPLALGVRLLQHSWRMPTASDWLANLHNPLVWLAVPALAALDAFVLDRWIAKAAPTKLSGETPKSVEKTLAQSLPVSLALQAGMAVGEELAYRWFVFGGLWALLAGLGWTPLLAFAAASAASSLLFGLAHPHGQLWTRVFGGLLYCAVFAVTGNLLFPILLHFLGNAFITIADRRKP